MSPQKNEHASFECIHSIGIVRSFGSSVFNFSETSTLFLIMTIFPHICTNNLKGFFFPVCSSLLVIDIFWGELVFHDDFNSICTY